jgi:septum formation protein
MLEAAGVPFEVADTPVDEELLKAGHGSLSAEHLAAVLAEKKAMSVRTDGSLVLGADQTLEHDDGSILHKANSREELAEQLRSLRGRPHWLHSAAAVTEAGKPVWQHTETVMLKMRDFSDAFLTEYLDRAYEEVRWSVGGYHVEAAGAQLFDSIEGSHFAVLGLPLLPLLSFLRQRELLVS